MIIDLLPASTESLRRACWIRLKTIPRHRLHAEAQRFEGLGPVGRSSIDPGREPTPA